VSEAEILTELADIGGIGIIAGLIVWRLDASIRSLASSVDDALDEIRLHILTHKHD